MEAGLFNSGGRETEVSMRSASSAVVLRLLVRLAEFVEWPFGGRHLPRVLLD